MIETKNMNNEISCAAQKKNGFHEKYLRICKTKNIAPVQEVKAKNRNYQEVLDFHADRLRPCDWLAITEALKTDKTLKFVAIRLRKNTGKVHEQVDTLKKAIAFTSLPVIYSRFIFTELMEAIQLLLTYSVIEILILEGLPIRDGYTLMLVKGLARNSSIKHLSLSRCNLGDAAVGEICQTINQMMNYSILDLSECDISCNGVESVANLIKMQKIKRYSEAWAESLRYRDVDADAFTGLRQINLRRNYDIGDQGIAVLCDVLCDDVWIKDVDVQNCGLSDEGAEKIIACLNMNKTILSFNIADNHDISNHYYKHIILHLGQSDSELSESSDSKDSDGSVTKSELLKKMKFLGDRYEVEILRRKRAEELVEKLEKMLKEMEQRILVQDAIKIPDGFTLVDNTTFNKLVLFNSSSSLQPSKPPTPTKKLKVQRRKRVICYPRKVSSCRVIRPASIKKPTRSEIQIDSNSNEKVFFEKKMGDAVDETRPSTGSTLVHDENTKQIDESGDAKCDDKINKTNESFDPRCLFSRSPNLVPNNSDAECE